MPERRKDGERDCSQRRNQPCAAAELEKEFLENASRAFSQSRDEKEARHKAKEAGYDINDPKDMDKLNRIHRYIRNHKYDFGWNELVEFLRHFVEE